MGGEVGKIEKSIHLIVSTGYGELGRVLFNTFLITFYNMLLHVCYVFTKIHLNEPRRTVSYCFPGSPGGPPGVPRVPWGPFPEGSRKFEEVGES